MSGVRRWPDSPLQSIEYGYLGDMWGASFYIDSNLSPYLILIEPSFLEPKEEKQFFVYFWLKELLHVGALLTWVSGHLGLWDVKKNKIEGVRPSENLFDLVSKAVPQFLGKSYKRKLWKFQLLTLWRKLCGQY